MLVYVTTSYYGYARIGKEVNGDKMARSMRLGGKGRKVREPRLVGALKWPG